MRHAPAPPIREVTDAEVARHFPLVTYTLNRMRRRGELVAGLEWDDLEAVGRWAIWEALRRWSPAKGKQSTYLSSYIWGYVMRHQRAATKATGWNRSEGGQIATIVHLDEPTNDEGTRTLGDTLNTHDDTAEQGEAHATIGHLRDRVNAMAPRDRAIAVAILAGIPPSSLAERLGISRGRISQIVPKIKAQLATDQPANPGGTLVIDRTLHPTERDAIREARRVRPDLRPTATRKRKVRDHRIVAPQGRSSASGSLGRPVWTVELAA